MADRRHETGTRACLALVQTGRSTGASPASRSRSTPRGSKRWTSGRSTERSSRSRRPALRGSGSGWSSDDRQGFAHAGALDERLIDGHARRRPGQRKVRHPRRVTWDLAEPDGVVPPELDLWDPEVASLPTDRQGPDGARSREAGPAWRPEGPPGGFGRLRRHAERVGHRHLDWDRGLDAGGRCAACRSLRSRATTPTVTPASGSVSAAARSAMDPRRSPTTPSSVRPG